MKKIIIALCIGAALASCDNHSSDKFIGTWHGDQSNQCKYQTVVIAKNNNGQGLSITHLTDTESITLGSGRLAQQIPARHDKEFYTASIDGDTLIIHGKTDLPIMIQNNSIIIQDCNYVK